MVTVKRLVATKSLRGGCSSRRSQQWMILVWNRNAAAALLLRG